MPYAPGIQYDASPLYAGISQLGKSVASAFEKRQDENKRTLQNGKIADSMVDANPEILDHLLTTPDEFKSLSASDKADKISGFMKGLGVQEFQQKQQEHAAQMQHFAQQSELARNQQEQGSIAIERAKATKIASGQLGEYFSQQANGYGPYPEGQEPDRNAANIMAQFGQQGVLTPENTDNLMSSFARARGAFGTEQTVFDEDPLTGNRYARNGRTILPSGVNPDKVSQGPAFFTGDDGTHYYGNRTKSGTTWTPIKEPRGILPEDRIAMQGDIRAVLDSVSVITLKPEQRLKLLEPIYEKYRKANGQSGNPAPPKVGEIIDGYEFLGGDPASPTNYRKQ